MPFQTPQYSKQNGERIIFSNNRNLTAIHKAFL